MAEEEGFEPPRAVKPLSVFKTDPFSRTWVFLLNTIFIIYERSVKVNIVFKHYMITTNHCLPLQLTYKMHLKKSLLIINLFVVLQTFVFRLQRWHVTLMDTRLFQTRFSMTQRQRNHHFHTKIIHKLYSLNTDLLLSLRLYLL